MERGEAIDRFKTLFMRRSGRYRAAFEDHEHGAWVLADLYHVCHMGRSTWNTRKPSTEETLINEGKRQVFIHILAQLRGSEADFHRLAEHQANEERRLRSTMRAQQ